MKINKEMVKNMANKAFKKAAENKELTATTIFGIAAGAACVKAIKHKKEKGIPENYENDAKSIMKECDWLVMAQ